MANKSKYQSRSSMSWMILSFGGLVLLGLAWWVFSTNRSLMDSTVKEKGAPQLKVDRQKVDFGDVEVGEYVEANFSLSNEGEQPLIFSEDPYIEVLSGC